MRELAAFQSIQSQIFGATMYKQINIGDKLPANLGIAGTAFQVVPGVTRELAGDTSYGVRYAEQYFDVKVYYTFENANGNLQVWLNRDDVTALMPSVIRALEGFQTVAYVIDAFRLISITAPEVLSPGGKIGVVTFHCAYAYRYL